MSNIERLEELIGHRFRNRRHLVTAMTHPSVPDRESYERLEFLGDLVLDFVVGVHLFKKHPREAESFLTDLKSAYVNRRFLHDAGVKLKLKRYLQHRANGPLKLDNFLEALIGALYLDGGWKRAEAFIRRHILATEMEPLVDYKNLLASFSRRKYGTLPVYRLSGESGPMHEKRFTVKVGIPGRRYVGMGRAGSRKEAEMLAARNLLEKHKVRPFTTVAPRS